MSPQPSRNFVVSIASFFDNDTRMYKVEAESDMEAIYAALKQHGKDVDSEAYFAEWETTMREQCKTAEDIKREMFDGDMGVGVMEI